MRTFQSRLVIAAVSEIALSVVGAGAAHADATASQNGATVMVTTLATGSGSAPGTLRRMENFPWG